MGYTHYLRIQEPISDDRWAAIIKDLRKLLVDSNALWPGLCDLIQRESDDPSPAEFSEDLIAFNGKGDNGHETFYVGRNDTGFHFCKTAQKPYDAAVVAALTVMKHYLGDSIKVSSDGDWADWEDAVAATIRSLPHIDATGLKEGLTQRDDE